MRLLDNIKQEFSHTFFKVSIHNENKFSHKQAACWTLEIDRSLLSADQLPRVAVRGGARIFTFWGLSPPRIWGGLSPKNLAFLLVFCGNF
jgi:hypothetical protein